MPILASLPTLFNYKKTRFTVVQLFIFAFVFRKPQYKDVCRRTIEIPQHARLLKVNYCLKVHTAHQKLLLPISGQGLSGSVMHKHMQELLYTTFNSGRSYLHRFLYEYCIVLNNMNRQ